MSSPLAWQSLRYGHVLFILCSMWGLAREGPKGACVVCLSNFRSCVFLECGHVCACTQCYRALPEPRRCPICRQEISRVVRLYNS